MVRLVPTKQWRDFSKWCRSRRLRALPANAWTLSAYIRACEPTMKPEAIHEAVAAIARHHLLRCVRSPDRHPMVQDTLQALEKNADLKGSQSALFDAEQFLEAEPPKIKRLAPEKKNKPRRIQMRAQPKLVSRRPT